MVATAGSVIANQQLVSQVNGSSITGPAIFPLLNEGVARINATNTLYSSNGTDGQILIGSSTGPTQWSSLTSDGSITITPGHNSVQLSTAAPRSAYFQFQQPDTGYLWGHLPNIWFGDGTPTLTLLQDNTGGCFRGAPGTPASYHCPTALGGMYTFIIRTAFYTLAHRGIGECRSRMTIQLGWPTPIQQYIFHLVSNPFMGIEPFNGEYSETFWVAPGQYVIFGIEYYHPNITYDVGLNNTTTITGYLVS